MFILSFFFILSVTNLLIKRSENFDFVRPKLFNSHSCNSLLFTFTLLICFINWAQLQVILMLLSRSGIEKNPGPESSQGKCSSGCTINSLGICGTSHTCEVRGCNF